MNKQHLLTILFAFIAMTIVAQDKLIRVDSTSTAWRKDNPQMMLNEQEKIRLLMPQGAAFGVECVPSFSPEWMLTYDSVAHSLVYKIAEKSIWHATYKAMHERKGDGNNQKWVLRDSPKDYEAPSVKTYTLVITPEQVQMLRAIWKTAVYQAEDKEVNILDGVKWEYFIDGRRAKTHRDKNVLVKFTNELVEAVRNSDASRKDSLIGTQFQRVIDGLTIAPAPEVLEPGTVRTLIVVNEKPLTDSLGNYVSNLGMDELVYFNKRQQSIRMVSYVREESDLKRFAEEYGVKVKNQIVKYTIVPDTLSDAYVNEHPHLKETHRYVEGYVLDEEDNPIADAWVYVVGKSRMGTGTATNSKGHFAFWPSRTDKLLVASRGIDYIGNIPITNNPIIIRMKTFKRK